MGRRYPGGLITSSLPSPTSSAASGMWVLIHAMRNREAGNWPVFVPDYFAFSSATFSSPIQSQSYRTSTTPNVNAYGPTQAELQSYYNGNDATLASLLSANTYFKVPYNGYQWFTIPSTGSYTITAQGGTGGPTSVLGRAGCKLTATFALTKGEIIWIAVGQSGSSGNASGNDWCSAGGGGATTVAKAPAGSNTSLSSITTCLLMAAGGLGPSEARFGPSTPSPSSSSNGSSGSAFINNFKSNNYNGNVGGYGGYYATGGFGGGTGTDDSQGYAGGYDSFVTSNPNSYVDSSGTSVTRVDSGDYRYPNAGYVTITKVA